MVKRKAYLLDVGYTVRDDETYLTLLVKGKVKSRLLYRLDPYFLIDAPEEKSDAIMGMEAVDRKGNNVRVKRIETVEKKIGPIKKKLLKVFCKRPSDVPTLKSAIPFPCYEHSIPFARRAVFDLGLIPLGIIHYERDGQNVKRISKMEPAKPVLSSMAFDIETYNPEGMPREKKDPAIMVSYAADRIKGVCTFKESKKDYVLSLSNEREMIDEFLKTVRKSDPDILFGYNSGNFDIPYLIARSEANGQPFGIGWKGEAPRQVRKGQLSGFEIPGRVHIDLYPISRFFGFIGVIKAQRFTLDSIAEEVLGRNKVDIDKEDMWKQWDSGDIEHLAEYSLIDSEITHELGLRLLPILTELSSLTRIPLFDITLSTSGQMVENLLMSEAAARGMLIPKKPGGQMIYDRINAPIQGAFVKLPEPGIYDNIAVMDFRGLYPSIIISYNIDPDTLVPEGERAGDCYTSPTGARFLKEPTGLVPSVLSELVELRGGIKGQIKNLDKQSDEYVRMSARSQSIKIVSNSFYGFLAYARSRWYSRDCAESVTAWGRKHIMDTIEKAEQQGFQVLYGDTDSLFLLLGNRKREDVDSFLDSINEHLPEKMELEMEGLYTRGVFVSRKGGEGAKKRYAMLGEDGRIKIRGFELVRRDWSRIAKDTQKKVLEAILKDGSKGKAVSIVRKTIERLKNGNVPIEELAISTQLNKDPSKYEVVSPELSAAKKMMAKGKPVEQGTMISYVIGRKGDSISEKAVPASSAEDYDADYYINNQLLPAVLKILKELGYDEYGLKMGGEQQSLESFF
jgi:DNA polymerase I